MYQFGFERLTVWQNSRLLAIRIYKITRSYPNDEKFGLVNQIRRAVISVSSNIAEGSSRNTAKDQAHFYNTAFGSLMEVLSQLVISLDLEYITETEYNEIRDLLEKVSNQLNSLRNSIVSNNEIPKRLNDQTNK